MYRWKERLMPKWLVTKCGKRIFRHMHGLRIEYFVRNHFRKWCVDEDIYTQSNEGFAMWVSPHDYASYGIYFFGEYDPMLTVLMRMRIPEGSTCIDVGTERGWFTLLMATLVGSEGRVESFEVCPQNHKRLTRNVNTNYFYWVKTHNVGVSDHVGKAQFVLPSNEVTHHVDYLADCSGVGYLTEKAMPGTIEVSTTTLDQHVNERRLSRVDFIKMDIEGSEYAALCGARETIRFFRPTIVVEYNRETARRAGSSLEQLDSLLENYGYDRYVVDRCLKRLNLEHWKGKTDNETVFNVCCLPKM